MGVGMASYDQSQDINRDKLSLKIYRFVENGGTHESLKHAQPLGFGAEIFRVTSENAFRMWKVDYTLFHSYFSSIAVANML